MPFTPTHVLAVVPVAALARGALPFAALAVGSMVPDVPLFMPWGPAYETTHSAAGLLTACLPLGLAVFAAFELILKRPLVALLPRSTADRLATAPGPPPRAWLLAPVAVVLGASTHVVWDAFTHRGRWGTRLVPALNGTALTLGGYDVPGYKAFQYGSTFVGLPLLCVLAAVWLRRRAPAPGTGPTLPPAAKALAWGGALAVPAGVTALVWRHSELSRYERLGQAVTGSGLALAAAALVYALAFRAVGRGRRGRAPRPHE